MKIIHAVFVYTTLVNACVMARGGRGGGSRGGRGRGSSRSSLGSHGLRGSHGYHHMTSGHSHYTYYPPKKMYYTCRQCLSTATYPVYRHRLPNYVYEYKESRGRHNQLLTGLAIYNLGRSSKLSHSGSGTRYSGYQREKCSLQVIENHHFEETEFPCFLISSFAESSPNNNSNTVDITSSEIKVKPDLYDGSTLQVTENQECVLWRNISTRNERHAVPCALLKKYADTVQRSLAEPLMYSYIFIPIFGTGIIVILCYYVYTKKTKVEEATSLKESSVATYRTN